MSLFKSEVAPKGLDFSSNEMILDNFLNGGKTTTFGTVMS